MKVLLVKVYKQGQNPPLNNKKNYSFHPFALGNFSVTGFELVLKRKMSHYIITYYFPAGKKLLIKLQNHINRNF